MKRYLLFAGDTYYPCGGWEDFIGEYVSIDITRKRIKEGDAYGKYDWWHIVDTSSNRVVEMGGEDCFE